MPQSGSKNQQESSDLSEFLSGPRLKQASTTYDFRIKAPLESAGAGGTVEWSVDFSRPLQELMYPSLIMERAKTSPEGNRGERGRGRLSFREKEEEDEKAAAAVDEDPMKLSLRWKMRVTGESRPASPDQQQQQQQRVSTASGRLVPGTFDHDLKVLGENHLRAEIREVYEEKVRAEKIAKLEAQARQRKIAKFGAGTVEAEERAAAARARNAGRQGGLEGTSSGNNNNNTNSSSSGGGGRNINEPAEIYSKMRDDAHRKHLLSHWSTAAAVATVEEKHKTAEADLYNRQRTLLTEVLGPQDFTSEGLMYYRMGHERAERRREAIANEEPTAMRGAPSPTGEDGEGGSHFGSTATGSPLRVLRGLRDKKRSIGYVESDGSQVNLTNLQRAILTLNLNKDQARSTGSDLKFERSPRNLLQPPITYPIDHKGRLLGAGNHQHDDAISISRSLGLGPEMDHLHGSQSQSAASRVSASTRVAQDRLITAQLEAGVLPEAFIKRSSNLEFVDVDVSMYSIGDEQGLCLGRAIKDFDTLQKLNLNDNRLTGTSVAVIMKNASPLSLQVLTLSSNLLRDRGASAVALFLSASNSLQVLNLADCSLFCDDVTVVCKAILKGHSPFLRELDVSRNQINVDGGAAVAEVLKGRSGSAYTCSLASVNLAWNHVGTQGIISISAALEANSSLTSLNLSGNAVTDQAGQRLADALFSNSSLKDLNLSQNLVGGCSCFVFSKAVKVHPNITKLDLSRNPLGEAGARSFYRTILRGLRCFVIMRSCSYFTDDKIFNYSSPSEDSPYDLLLDEPYKRAVLTELMIMAGEDPLSCRFGHVGWTDGKPGSVETVFPLAVKDGVVINKTTGKEFKPPRTGKMVVHFYSSVPPPTMARAATATAVNIIQAIVSAAREEDRVDYLRLLCFDVYCTTAQAQLMIQTFAQRRILGSGGLRQIDVVSCIWSRLIDTKNMYDFLCLNVPMQERRDLVNTLTIEEFRFNWTNPSGYWRLNLQKPKQRMVMKKIIAINSVEAAFSRRKSGRLDTSQEGNWFNFRNGKYFKNAKSKGQLVVIDQEYVDKLPKTGTLEFDYVSTTRPGHEPNYDLIEEEGEEGEEGAAEGDAGAEGEGEGESQEGHEGTGHEGEELDGLGEEASLGSASQKSGADLGPTISDDDFVRLLVTLQLSSRRKIPQEKNMFYLMELQLVSAKYYFTVANVIQIMDCFSLDSASQTKVVVVLFSRIRDLYNMDQLLKGLAPKTQRELLRRLGCLNVLNPLKLAFDYHISMKHLDERILLTLLLEISPNEGTDQIVESPKTDVSVITFYGQLHRIVSAVRDDTLIFNYAEVGEKTTIVAWGMRREALRKFLIGTKPLEAGLFRVISMYGEMQRHGTLTRGPIELQYNSHLKALASLRRAELSKKQALATREAMKRGDTQATPSSPRPAATD